jgi:hypothetical protein
MMKKSLLLLLLLLAVFVVNYSSAAENTAMSLFPLEKGAVWLYKGKIEWTPEGENQKVKSRIITWPMTVKEVFESPAAKVALVTGFPNDVAWYEEGMTPKCSLIVEAENAVYWNGYETEKEAQEAAKTIVEKAANNGDDLHVLFEFPLTEGKLYDSIDESRTDNMYAWYVEKVTKATIKVKGLKARKVNKSKVIYRTNPDHIIVVFAESVGIVRYVYEHHGTVAFEDLRLVEYRAPKKSTPNSRQDRGR